MRRVDPRRHVREAESDRLVLRDRLAELLPGLRVIRRVLECGTSEPGCGRAERDARAVERLHETGEPLALLAETTVRGHLDVLEKHLCVDDRALAHLLHRRTEGDALVAP